jgi:ParB family chromosome partitioning protein
VFTLGLTDDGMPVEDVAARFGVTPTVVTQRLRLAAVSPVLRKQFREGQLTLAQMMAFALVDDHAAQEAAWAELPEWSRGPDSIRRALIKEGLSATHPMCRFVGVEAYEAAGGLVLRDLFEEDGATLADGALVERLAVEKLNARPCGPRAGNGSRCGSSASMAAGMAAFGRWRRTRMGRPSLPRRTWPRPALG